MATELLQNTLILSFTLHLPCEIEKKLAKHGGGYATLVQKINREA